MPFKPNEYCICSRHVKVPQCPLHGDSDYQLPEERREELGAEAILASVDSDLPDAEPWLFTKSEEARQRILAERAAEMDAEAGSSNPSSEGLREAQDASQRLQEREEAHPLDEPEIPWQDDPEDPWRDGGGSN